ncbi:hypothetical protein [Spirosoma sp. KUDC1026]|uniref:hypothetical protein n=1 Tax=Spirosoma sp. KUDC1026 TaxID=2745947 RepID=UPI00159B96C3|nr:hypothetical protein [Spirosoma sp. KUDC1026]QKZ13657.1 hypothetical protein HU175_13850 [Spirosoma sp. KUDC1026]
MSSSLCLKACGLFPDFIGWAEGTERLPIPFASATSLSTHIKRQKGTRLWVPFPVEYRVLIDEHGVAYDDTYLLSD